MLIAINGEETYAETVPNNGGIVASQDYSGLTCRACDTI
jgi:hypothetical protein